MFNSFTCQFDAKTDEKKQQQNKKTTKCKKILINNFTTLCNGKSMIQTKMSSYTGRVCIPV